MKTLEKFLKDNNACKDVYDFAKNLTLEQFLNTCDRGDWILWLFEKSNPESSKEITLAKAHCANTVRHLMKDESKKAVDVAIAFGNGKATREELNAAASAAFVAYAAAYVAAAAHTAVNYAYAAYAVADAIVAADAASASASSDAAYAAHTAVNYAYAAYAASAAADASAASAAYASAYSAYASADDAASASAASAAKNENQQLTSEICITHLPIEIWNINKKDA